MHLAEACKKIVALLSHVANYILINNVQTMFISTSLCLNLALLQ